MNSDQTIRELQLALAAAGLRQEDRDAAYFCTPKGARILGWTGVDGIHCCLIRGFGEMVFAVSPMDPAPPYVRPLARNFSDFLRLLLACGSWDALEQAWQWDETQFAAFLRDNPAPEERKAALAQIGRQTGLAPMEDPYRYLRELQAAFDYSRIPYTRDFYDLDLNPAAPRQPEPWKVTFRGGFCGPYGRERAGKEVPVRREFVWAGRHWTLPSVYLCGRGMVADFCMRADPAEIRAFLEKWGLSGEDGPEGPVSRERQMQMDRENPLRLDFRPVLVLNGTEYQTTHGFGAEYNPCLPPEDGRNREGERAVEHYGLDPAYAWVFLRASYPWRTKRRPALCRLSVTMIQEAAATPGPHFRVSRPGDTASFSFHGRTYRLTVEEYEAQTMDWSRMPDTGLERPSHYTMMSYTIAPEPPDGSVMIVDCDDGDRPRQAPAAPGQPTASSYAMVVGIIGGGDGPAVLIPGQREPGRLRVACSSLHFAPADEVEWRVEFCEKQFDDASFDLLPQ